MKKLLLFGIIFSLITLVQFSQINYRYTGRGEYYFKGTNLRYGDIIPVDEFMYMDNFEVVDQGSDFPELYLLREQVNDTTFPQISDEVPTGQINGTNDEFTLSGVPVLPVTQDSLVLTLTEYPQATDESPTGDIDGQNQTYDLDNTDVQQNSLDITLTEYPQVTDETPTGQIDGSNTDFTLSNLPVTQDSVSITLTEYTVVGSETPTGDINSQNTSYTLQNSPVVPGSLELVVDSEATQVTDDGQGTLSDGGTVTYSTGVIELVTQPDTTIVQTYTYSAETQITDDATGTLSDGGSVVFSTGVITLASQPQTGSDLSVDYTYTTETEIVDDGQGTLSDGGTVTYSTGEFILSSQPQAGSLISQDYIYETVTTITDDASGTLSDGGEVSYTDGVITLASQPQTGSLIGQDYTYSKQTSYEFEVEKLQNVTIEVQIDESNAQDLTLYYNSTSSTGVPLTQDYEAVVNSKNFYKIIIENSNADAIYTVTFKDNDLISE